MQGPTPTNQDGALGAGGTSALGVLVSYMFGDHLPAPVIAAAAPFVSFSLTYLVAATNHWRKNNRRKKDELEYNAAVQAILDNPEIDTNIKDRIKEQRHETMLLSVETLRKRILKNMEDSQSSSGFSISEFE
jgi:hypothetical protein